MQICKHSIGDTVGIVSFNFNRPKSVTWAVIKSITPTGYITLGDGTTYLPSGKERNALHNDPTYLYPLDKAREIEAQIKEKESASRLDLTDYKNSHKYKVDYTTLQVGMAVVNLLEQLGWDKDVEGNMDSLESEVKGIVSKYLTYYLKPR